MQTTRLDLAVSAEIARLVVPCAATRLCRLSAKRAAKVTNATPSTALAQPHAPKDNTTPKWANAVRATKDVPFAEQAMGSACNATQRCRSSTERA